MTVDINLHRIPAQSYGPLQVLKSAAGFYVGTLFNEGTEEQPFYVPGSRDSCYFRTYREAQNYLDFMTADDDIPFGNEADDVDICTFDLTSDDLARLCSNLFWPSSNARAC